MKNIIHIVSKVPKIGRSKSRLGKSIGNEFAFEFSKACLLDLCESLLVHKDTEFVILYYPMDEEKELNLLLLNNLDLNVRVRWRLEPASMEAPFSCEEINCNLQGLGIVLSRALEKERHSKCNPLFNRQILFLGMDAPHLESRIISKALNEKNGMICPARDGGYVLLSIPLYQVVSSPRIFANIQWSSPLTFATQMISLHKSGLRYVLVHDEIQFDIDEEVDLNELGTISNLSPRIANFFNNYTRV
jgi:glycosyltransferase A (GT-A) superfamily protein (DUF2064 family)